MKKMGLKKSGKSEYLLCKIIDEDIENLAPIQNSMESQFTKAFL